MKILYLYAEIMGYTMATIKALAERGTEVHVVHWDHKKLTPYETPKLPNVYLYKRSELSVEDMQQLANSLSPEIVVVAGWMDKRYMPIAKHLRLQGTFVVTGFDDQWFGTWRQKCASIISRFGYFSQYFSHAWVSGPCQFEYARRLGFDKKHIIYDLYSADLSLFQKAYQCNIELKQKNYPHRFLFAGRFEPVKGLDTLLKSWNFLGDNKRDWTLHLIGNGSLKKTLQSASGVVVEDFMQPERLTEEISRTGCFLVPSCNEPWGVVVHEFAAAGIPLIVSDIVGANSTFLISGLNGYSFKVNDVQSLANRMLQIIRSSDQKLLSMAQASFTLSHRISPQTSAENLLSITH